MALIAEMRPLEHVKGTFWNRRLWMGLGEWGVLSLGRKMVYRVMSAELRLITSWQRRLSDVHNVLLGI